jgi:hypothetical protein
MEGSFDVEEYKKPEYEVRVTPAKPRVLEGDTAQATIEARYYFGEPVSGAKVKYSVYRSRYWFPLFYDPDDDSGDPRPIPAPPMPTIPAATRFPTRKASSIRMASLTISFPTPVSDRKFDYRYRIEAHVTDDANRDIIGRGGLLATYGSFALNVSPDRYFYTAGSTAIFTVEARDYDNQSRANARAYRVAPVGPASALLRRRERQLRRRHRGGWLSQGAIYHSRRVYLSRAHQRANSRTPGGGRCRLHLDGRRRVRRFLWRLGAEIPADCPR